LALEAAESGGKCTPVTDGVCDDDVNAFIQAESVPTVVEKAQELTFHQVFMRSRALELAVDACTRAPELRAALREHALPLPAWPEDEKVSPGLAFARAFADLLEVVVGPADLWMPLLGTLLCSDAGPVDDKCHAWLVQLLVGLRSPWLEADALDREREAEALEEAAAQAVLGLEPPPDTEAGPGSLAFLLKGLSSHGCAAEANYSAWRVRSSLAQDLSGVAEKKEERRGHLESLTSTIAVGASDRAKELEIAAAKQRSISEETRGNLRKEEDTLRVQLDGLSPAAAQIERELEEAETTRGELMQQLDRVCKQIQGLRHQRDECSRQSEQLRGELQRVERTFAVTMAAEDAAQDRTEGARALASTVSELALGLKKEPTGCVQREGRLETSAQRSAAKAGKATHALAEQELSRLRLLLRTINLCVTVAEERQQSRKAMEELGVPISTLESDVVGEAEISEALLGTLAEVDRCRVDLRKLVGHLLKSSSPPGPATGGLVGTDPPSGACAAAQETDEISTGASIDRGSTSPELAKALQDCIAECDARREALAALAPEVATFHVTASGSRGSESSAPADDPFLLSM